MPAYFLRNGNLLVVSDFISMKAINNGNIMCNFVNHEKEMMLMLIKHLGIFLGPLKFLLHILSAKHLLVDIRPLPGACVAALLGVVLGV